MTMTSSKSPVLQRGAIAIALLSSLLCSCAALRPATVPIRSVTISGDGSGRCLAVLLPGRFAAPEGFAKEKFGESVAKRNLDLDVVAVDAHLGYYRTRTVIERIREDVILPARAKGYEEIWIAGASLGGLGSIIYLREHPDEVTGALAIAPFLGEDEVIREIEAAGGPRSWTQPADATDIGRTIWSWLAVQDFSVVPLRLGWGTSDSFDQSNRLLASLLPPGRTFAVPGGHDLETWNRVWEKFLDEAKPCRKKQ